MSEVTSSIEAYLADLRRLVDAALERVLASQPAPPVLSAPVRYSLLGPGKRLRPCLTLAAAEATRGDLSVTDAHALALSGACAVEMIHAYSLVHDDLPAMDDDDLRRGRPTTHVMYGDGLAILAGDALLTEAFVVLAHAPSPAGTSTSAVVPDGRRLAAIARLAEAAGVAGMVGGQAIDLSQASGVGALEGAAALEDMHLRKTGALIRAAATVGAIMVGAADHVVRAVDEYARELGLAFQIVDDILDVEGSREAMGKTAGKDAAAGKVTFPTLHGLDQSKRLAAACVARAKGALEQAHVTGRLGEIADWSLGRVK
jgi:geranylgeranyl pyrophosphate synthase